MKTVCPFPCNSECAERQFGLCDLMHVLLGAASTLLPPGLQTGVGVGFVGYEALRDKPVAGKLWAIAQYGAGVLLGMLVLSGVFTA
jgi:hypothetical protein